MICVTQYWKWLGCILLLMAPSSLLAEDFKIDGQILQRSEIRNGYGNLRPADSDPAIFTGQRSRINAIYSGERTEFKVSGQDIRIWGSTPQMKASDNFLSIHEAWGRFNLTGDLFLKAGRQELAYDEQRFLGNVDWALQARAHDIFLLQYEGNPYSVQGGAAFNQEEARLTGHFYDLPGQYKSAQFAWANLDTASLSLSGLFWNEGRQFLTEDPEGDFVAEVNHVQAFGLTDAQWESNPLSARAFYHHQTGEDTLGRDKNAYNLGVELNYTFPVFEDHKLGLTGGFEILSGQSQIENDDENNAFQPSYGTNHRFNGYMDYFYAGGRHVNTVGLQDYHLRVKYEFSPEAFLSLNTHYFLADGNIADPEDPGPEAVMDSYLGTEIDLTGGLVLYGPFSIQAGYSHMLGTSSFETLRGGSHDDLNQWGYIALLFRPGEEGPFTGLKF